MYSTSVRMATEKEYKKEDLVIWFCGFYEGEGSVSNDIGNNNRLRLSISQNDKTPLEIAKKLWGGAIAKRIRKSPASEKVCIGHEWRLPHKQSLVFIEDIKPFMIIPQKINQITHVLEVFNRGDKFSYKCKSCEKEYANPSGRRRHFKHSHQDTDASGVVNTLQEDQIAGTS